MTTSRENLIEAIRKHELGGFKYPGSELLRCLAQFILCQEQKCPATAEKAPALVYIPHTPSEKEQKIAEGFISLTHFGKNTLHKTKGAILAGGKIGAYIRKMPEIFKDAYYQEFPRAEYFVHPERIISLLVKHASRELRNDLTEYLSDIQNQEKTCNLTDSQLSPPIS